MAIDGEAWPGLVVVGLGLDLPLREASCESFVRESDLVLTYPEWERRQNRVQVYWRLADQGFLGAAKAQPAAMVETIVSVQTDLLDACPELSVHSFWPGAACRVATAQDDQFVWCNLGAGAALPLRIDCAVWLSQRRCCAQMLHPAGVHDSVCVTSDFPGVCSFEHRLFGRFLEKGVILRARLLTLFFPDAAAEPVLEGLYREYARTEPVLTA